MRPALLLFSLWFWATMRDMDEMYSLEEIRNVAESLLKQYGNPESEHATIWALAGDLGAGKTTLVQALARTLGVEEIVTSPTFILEKIYPLEEQAYERLIHIDVYRFENPQELHQLNFDALIKDPKNLIVLEWPERVKTKLPSYTQWFDITIVNESTRRIVARGSKTHG